MDPIFSRRADESFTPPGSPRTYQIAALTLGRRAAFRADVTRLGGTYPSRAHLFDVIRRVVLDISPGNAESLIAIIDQAYEDEAGEDRAIQEQVAEIEAMMATQPPYANLIAARVHHANMLPIVTAAHVLRGWSGPMLPPFRRERDVVPDDLLELLPEAELVAIGNRGLMLMQVGSSAEGNSEPP